MPVPPCNLLRKDILLYTFATGSKRKNSHLNVKQISIALKMFGQCHRQLGVTVSDTSVNFSPVYIFLFNAPIE